MNPFASVDSFEDLRRAALADAEVYKRFVRRLQYSKQATASDGELNLPDRVVRMIDLSIASGRAVLLVGPPGTGKTHALREAIERIDRDPEAHGFSKAGVAANWVTPEEEWSFETLVVGQTVVGDAIVSTEGVLLESLREGKWLILDEANRADMDRIFGGVLTWLSGRRVRIGDFKGLDGSQKPVYLDWSSTHGSYRDEDSQSGEIVYFAGSDWRMLGTYNAVDAQRVFRMGQALSRRFLHVPIPPTSEESFKEILSSKVPDNHLGRWITRTVAALYGAHLRTPDAELGPALFLGIPEYLLAGASTVGVLRGDDAQAGDSESAGLPNELLEELLGEAYLVCVGSFIAKFEPEVLDAIGAEGARRGALGATTWAWILSGLQWMRA